VFRGESGMLEFKVFGLKGGQRWLKTHAAPLHDESGRVTALLSITRDITDSRRAEAELQHSQEQLAGLIHTVDGIFWEADAQTFQFTFVSAQAERMLGYPAARWLDEPTFWKDHIHPEDRETAD